MFDESFDVKAMIRKIMQKGDILSDENAQMTRVIESLKSGKFNERAGAQTIADEAHSSIKAEIEVL